MQELILSHKEIVTTNFMGILGRRQLQVLSWNRISKQPSDWSTYHDRVVARFINHQEIIGQYCLSNFGCWKEITPRIPQRHSRKRDAHTKLGKNQVSLSHTLRLPYQQFFARYVLGLSGASISKAQDFFKGLAWTASTSSSIELSGARGASVCFLSEFAFHSVDGARTVSKIQLAMASEDKKSDETICCGSRSLSIFDRNILICAIFI